MHRSPSQQISTLGKVATGVAAILAITLVGGYFFNQNQSAWEARVVSTLEQARQARVEAEVWQLASEAQVEQAARLAEQAGEGVRVVERRVVEVREVEVPVEALPFVAPRDSIIDDLLVVVDRWEVAYDTLSTAHAALTVAYNTIVVAQDSVVAVLEDRPGPPPWWKPNLGLGAFTGNCLGGVGGCAGVGLTLSWKVSF